MINSAVQKQNRQNIYYWKCDRPAAFHGTELQRSTAELQPLVQAQLEEHFPEQEIQIVDGGGQGNHLTWLVHVDAHPYFLRVENGPEQDNQLDVESHIMNRVREYGVRTPLVHAVKTQRREVPFAWQLMELIPARDLNWEVKQGNLEAISVAAEIGTAIANWQKVPVAGFGHFQPDVLRERGLLEGFYDRYRDYFFLNWNQHLDFLAQNDFLKPTEIQSIRTTVEASSELLELTSGCLVHKDLAFWNILGDASGVAAYIDWDDAIAADEMDDLSLLGCFHDGNVIEKALEGYEQVRPLPEEFAGRFWLHLLRNMIVKSVIRVGAGYFTRTDGFFLIGAGMTGADLVKQTRSRIFRVLEGLQANERPQAL